MLPIAILIPARDEAANLDGCLAAAAASSAAEILVADDSSRDGTAAIAAGWAARDPRIRCLSLAVPPPGWAGKNYALWRAAEATEQPWLLFLDADTRLLAGGLERAWHAAESQGWAALSVSPEQETSGLFECAVQARIFDMLDRRFPPARVNDASDRCAAANGQFLLIRRDAYSAVGGHGAVAAEWLEDVALARRIKSAGWPYRLGDGRDVARTRMYRSRREMWLGWRKNFAALFGPPRAAAVWPLALPLAAAGLGAVMAIGRRRGWPLALAYLAVAHARYAGRLRAAGRAGAWGLLPANAWVLAVWYVSARRGPGRWKGRALP